MISVRARWTRFTQVEDELWINELQMMNIMGKVTRKAVQTGRRVRYHVFEYSSPKGMPTRNITLIEHTSQLSIQ